MKKWIKFIIIPIVILLVLELLASFVVGGIFWSTPDSFLCLVSFFIVHFIVGTALYHFSPSSNKIIPATTFAVIFIVLSVYYSVITDGEVTEMFGERVVLEFLVLPKIVNAAGMILAIFGAHQNEIDENKVKESA